MYPHERSLVVKNRNRPFAIIGVNSDKDREATRQVVKQENLTWRSFWNGQQGIIFGINFLFGGGSGN